MFEKIIYSKKNIKLASLRLLEVPTLKPKSSKSCLGVISADGILLKESLAWGMKCEHTWVFPKKGGTPKWMVKIMENPTKMDDLGIPSF